MTENNQPFPQGPAPQYFAPAPLPKKKKWPWIVGAVVVLGAIGAATGGGKNTSAAPGPVTAVAASTAATDDAAKKAADAEKKAAQEKAAAEAAARKAAAEQAAKEKAAQEQQAAQAAAEARIANATERSERDLALLAKKPDGHTGETMVVYGKITQFDAATGACTFRATIGHTNMAQTYSYEHNSIFTGGDGKTNCPALGDFVTDDEVRITATSLGSFSYDTQIGGNTTVPMFKVEAMSLAG
jgi:hypothetical protein